MPRTDSEYEEGCREAAQHSSDLLFHVPLIEMPGTISEIGAERELDITLTATNAAALGGYFSEVRAGGVEVHTGATAAPAPSTPIRVVNKVKCLGPELEPCALGNRERFEQSEIPVLESRLVNQVSNVLRVERPGRRCRKDRRAVRVLRCEPLSIRAEGTDNRGVAINHPVLAVDAAS